MAYYAPRSYGESPWQELQGTFFPRIGKTMDDVDAEDTNGTGLQEQRRTEGLIIATIWVFVSAIAFVALVAFFWPALPVEHGYPSIGVTPGAPGPFLSQRYTFMWVCVYLLSINYAVSAFLALAVASPGRITGIFLHYLTAVFSGFINFVVGIGLLIANLWYCNGARATWNAMGNDVHWCCVHSLSSTVATELCGAIAPMCSPAVGQSDLTTNPAYVWMMVAAWIFFFFSIAHLYLNWKLKTWGVWSLRG